MQLGLGVYNFSVQNLQLFLTTRGFLQSCFSRASPDSFRIGSMQLFHASAFQFHTKGTWKGCRNFPLLESTAGQQTLFFVCFYSTLLVGYLANSEWQITACKLSLC